jgi:hypothetical protein
LSRQTKDYYDLEEKLTLPLLKGSVHIRKYFVEPSDLLLLFPYEQHVGGRYINGSA